MFFDEWAKLQKCNFCGIQGHVCPQCKKYLAAKENGTLGISPTGYKCNTKPFFNKDNRREKFNKDPKLKALLSAFAAFTSDYLADSQTEHDEKNDKQDKPDGDTVEDNEDVNALLGMFGALKE